jgi:hypothetical protein
MVVIFCDGTNLRENINFQPTQSNFLFLDAKKGISLWSILPKVLSINFDSSPKK